MSIFWIFPIKQKLSQNTKIITPSELTNAHVELLKYLSSTRNWNYFACVTQLLSQTLSTSLIRSIRSLRANTVLVFVVAVQKTGKPNTALDFIRISSCLVAGPSRMDIYGPRFASQLKYIHDTQSTRIFFPCPKVLAWSESYSVVGTRGSFRPWQTSVRGHFFSGSSCVCVAIRAIHSQIGLNQWPIQIGYWTPQLPFAPWNTSPRVVGLTTWLDWGDDGRRNSRTRHPR